MVSTIILQISISESYHIQHTQLYMCTFFHYDKMWTQVYSFSRTFCKLYHSKLCLCLFIYLFTLLSLFISFFIRFSLHLSLLFHAHTHTIHFKQYQRVLELTDSGIDQIALVSDFAPFFSLTSAI